jgi:hypothetical protein
MFEGSQGDANRLCDRMCFCLFLPVPLSLSASLLKEAEFHAEQREHELNRRRQLGLSSSHHSLDNTDFDNKDDDKHDQRLLSQFGIWFLVRKRRQPLSAPLRTPALYLRRNCSQKETAKSEELTLKWGGGYTLG